MKICLVLFIILAILYCTFISSVQSIQCRVCSEERICELTSSPLEWQIEECPISDQNCNVVWKVVDGRKTIIYGGCVTNKINHCVDAQNKICVTSCEGNLCNENIKDLNSNLIESS